MRIRIYILLFCLFAAHMANGQGNRAIYNQLNQTHSAGGSYDVDAQAYFDQIVTNGGTALTTTVKGYINTLVLAMKADGTWSKLIDMHPIPNTNTTACAVNLKTPSATAATFVASPTITSTGVTLNASSQYINSNVNASTSLTLNSAALGFYSESNTSGNWIDMGCYNGTNLATEFLIWNSTFAAGGGDINSNGVFAYTTAPTNKSGLFILSRTSSTAIAAYRNGTSLGSSSTAASASKPNLNIYVGCENNNGTAGSFSGRTISLYFISTGLTSTDVTNITTDIQAYENSMGRQITP